MIESKATIAPGPFSLVYFSPEELPGAPLPAPTIWEPAAFPMKSGESFDRIYESMGRYQKEGAVGSVVLRAVEKHPDGTKSLVETTSRFRGFIHNHNDHGSPPVWTGEHPMPSLSENDFHNLVSNFDDYLYEAYPELTGRLEMEVLVAHHFKPDKAGLETIQKQVDRASYRALLSRVGNKSRNGDRPDQRREFVSGQEVVLGASGLSVERGLLTGNPEAVEALSAQPSMNLHEAIPSVDGTPLQVPEIIKNNNMTLDQTSGFFRAISQRQESVDDMHKRANELAGLLEKRNLPGWKEDRDALMKEVSKAADREGLSGDLAIRRLKNDISDMIGMVEGELQNERSRTWRFRDF